MYTKVLLVGIDCCMSEWSDISSNANAMAGYPMIDGVIVLHEHLSGNSTPSTVLWII